MRKYRLHEKAWKQKDSWRLVNENWSLCHEIVDLRDGHCCVICLKERDLQLDHDISRTHKSVFFDTDHLNWLCNVCHSTKSFNPSGALSAQVREVTRKRVGIVRLNEIIEQANKVCPQWRTVAWQEACNDQLKEELELVKSVSELKGWKS
jgi:hypothetical protein